MKSEYQLVVPPGKTRERLDLFLTHHVEQATRAKIQQAIKDGNVTVNGQAVKASYKISPGEIVHLLLRHSTPTEAQPEDIPLDIVYEDDILLVVNKPAGMVTHPAYANYDGTLVNALLFHSHGKLSQTAGATGANGQSFFPRPGIVHRLDKDTSGLMVIAKDDATHAALAKQFSERTTEREYWAIVWGIFTQKYSRHSQSDFTVIEAPLGRSSSDRKKIAVIDSGKTAVTHYRVMEEFSYLSLVQCKLKTGRTHQIRVHMSHIGHPVFGDPTYGGRRMAWGGMEGTKRREVQNLLEIMTRQALHAKTIGFLHPVKKKRLFFDSPLPDDFEKVLSHLRHSKN